MFLIDSFKLSDFRYRICNTVGDGREIPESSSILTSCILILNHLLRRLEILYTFVVMMIIGSETQRCFLITFRTLKIGQVLTKDSELPLVFQMK